jgi:TM2 domain-containing membrane protein YozV
MLLYNINILNIIKSNIYLTIILLLNILIILYIFIVSYTVKKLYFYNDKKFNILNNKIKKLTKVYNKNNKNKKNNKNNKR